MSHQPLTEDQHLAFWENEVTGYANQTDSKRERAYTILLWIAIGVESMIILVASGVVLGIIPSL